LNAQCDINQFKNAKNQNKNKNLTSRWFQLVIKRTDITDNTGNYSSTTALKKWPVRTFFCFFHSNALFADADDTSDKEGNKKVILLKQKITN
jgi:hypothetical protein